MLDFCPFLEIYIVESLFFGGVLDKQFIEKLISTDPLLWAHYRGLRLRESQAYDLSGFSYQAPLLEFDRPYLVWKKGTQVGLTTVLFVYCLWSCIYHKIQRGIIYMMPTNDTVNNMARSCFNPLVQSNGFLKRYISADTNDNKVINGHPILFTGSQLHNIGGTGVEENRNLRSFSADVIIRDELDHIPSKAIEQSKQRIHGSELGYEVDLASPTFPDYGIEASYSKSSQGKYQIKCECGKHTCIETSFPRSITLVDGRWRRTCVHCGREIFIKDGQWIDDVSDSGRTGRWVSSFLHPKADLGRYMERYLSAGSSELAEFMRSVLGVGTAEAEVQLSVPVVLSRCGTDLQQVFSSDRTVMGVDVGKKLHYVIGQRIASDGYRILQVGTCDEWSELHQVSKKMHVNVAVVDSMPELHSTKEFARSADFAVFMCRYSTHMVGRPQFERKDKTVKCNRTEWCDKVHELFSTEGRIQLPHQSPGIEEYADSMSKTARIIEDDNTGGKKAKWVKIGEDHFFHATLYFLLAASRSSIAKPKWNRTPQAQKCKLAYSLGA